MRKKVIFILTGLAVLLIVVWTGATYFMKSANHGSELGIYDPVAVVNGEPIAYGELLHDLNAQRSSIYDYFRIKYGALDSEDFWTTAHGGETPIEMIKKQALERSVKRKIQQLIGKKAGIINDISYHTLLDNMKKENERRKETVKNKGVIYGPITYEEATYVEENIRNISTDLKEKLKNDFKLTDQDYEDYYASKKDELYKLEDLKTVRAIMITFTNKADKKKKQDDAAIIKLETIKKRMDAGESFDEIYDELVHNKDETVTAVEKVLGDFKTKEEFIKGQDWLKDIENLRVGQVSDIVEDTDRIGIYKYMDKRERDYKPLKEVKETMKNVLRDIKYEAFINQSVKEATVEVIEENVNKVRMR
ncbi:peptidyl-prolyl cis-trans isomerase [Paenibacillus sp. LHD-117]|uniref:peptidyl-prolyl cis-trans isomerase n=1 Tax=Paenibacillus sp. LHD-117 TaxID=3071412 RepID=UPI0027E0A7E2|nr:peptidyl-prolyl cis-trans isomerase [Paenibacillus sp. LHD-117]MDQ6423595.1 peptidyl-prolyl cis-trans isomerase [Paenibacillus sp. LHD-117]